MRRLILTFAIIAPVLMVALIAFGRPWLGIGVLMLSHALLLVPTLMPNMQWLGPVVTHFASDANEVWLTIDDGPTEDTPAILDVLERHGVHATFFLKGTLTAAASERARMIVTRGHTVGNHSQTHPSGSFWCLTPALIEREVDACSEVLREITGSEPSLFRAPVGMKNPFVHPLLRRRGLTLIGWTVRGFDALRDGGDDVIRRIAERLEPGAIIVMHQGRSWSARTIERVIEEVQRRGYRFVVPDIGRLNMKR
ncbi:MAG: polysaccharide deacetylase family protein [Thermoanaerobaculia bacterium]